MGETNKDNQNETITEPLNPESTECNADQESPKKEVNPLRQYQKRAFISSTLCVVFIALLAFLFFDEQYVKLGIPQPTHLTTYYHKLEYVLCYQLIGISWILFNMFYVISKRANSSAINPANDSEHTNIWMAKNIMQNSIEQFLMSAFAQLIGISFLETDILMRAIPMVNILFLIGRVTFFWGYPDFRTFGFMCTAIPTTLLINYNILKFIQNVFF